MNKEQYEEFLELKEKLDYMSSELRGVLLPKFKRIRKEIRDYLLTYMNSMDIFHSRTITHNLAEQPRTYVDISDDFVKIQIMADQCDCSDEELFAIIIVPEMFEDEYEAKFVAIFIETEERRLASNKVTAEAEKCAKIAQLKAELERLEK